MRITITLDKEQKPGQQIIDAFQGELARRVQSLFPLTKVVVKKGSMTGIELMGLDKETERKTLNGILQDVWEDESWR